MNRYRFGALVALLLAAYGAQLLMGQASTGPFDTLHFRPIGPAGMSGRISDLAVYEANTSIFYVAAAACILLVLWGASLFTRIYRKQNL